LEYFSLAEIAYKKIKEAILKHEIVPGERLSHEELVLRLKISQTPIREALSRLAQEGYVRTKSKVVPQVDCSERTAPGPLYHQ